MITDKHREAMKLVQDLTQQEIMALSHEVHNTSLHDEEHSKRHVLTDFRLSDEEWEDFRMHLRDGGGVIDDSALLDELNRAIVRNDQATFWHMLPHLLKARNLIHAKTVRHPRGGVQHSIPDADKPAPQLPE